MSLSKFRWLPAEECTTPFVLATTILIGTEQFRSSSSTTDSVFEELERRLGGPDIRLKRGNKVGIKGQIRLYPPILDRSQADASELSTERG